ncbi:UNVERIFIED_CONTAM: hypothetical protein Sradi_7111300, partial [Sesamum radiatum]
MTSSQIFEDRTSVVEWLMSLLTIIITWVQNLVKATLHASPQSIWGAQGLEPKCTSTVSTGLQLPQAGSAPRGPRPRVQELDQQHHASHRRGHRTPARGTTRAT